MLEKIYGFGLRPEHCYAAAFGSIALSYGTYAMSRAKTGDSKAQSDRWGIFIGHWAPSFFALGNALKLQEMS